MESELKQNFECVYQRVYDWLSVRTSVPAGRCRKQMHNSRFREMTCLAHREPCNKAQNSTLLHYPQLTKLFCPQNTDKPISI